MIQLHRKIRPIGHFRIKIGQWTDKPFKQINSLSISKKCDYNFIILYYNLPITFSFEVKRATDN